MSGQRGRHLVSEVAAPDRPAPGVVPDHGRARWAFQAGGVVLLVLVVGGATLFKSWSFFGHLLRGSDAQYYYGLARSLVVDGDLDITNDLELTPNAAPFDLDGDGRREALLRNPDGRVRNRFPVGLSLVEAPLLLLGRVVRGALGQVGLHQPGSPGYSQIEIATVAVGLLAITSVALAVLHRLIQPMVGPLFGLVAVGAAWLGTSLFHYTAIFPFMAHGLGFALVVGILATAHRARRGQRANLALLGFGALSALLFLVRPQLLTLPLLVLPWLIPILRRPARHWAWGLALAASLLVVAVGLEMAYTWQQLGLLRWSRYRLEAQPSFNWSAPGLAVVLWEQHRGLFWFSPVVLLGCLGYVGARFRDLPWFAWPLLGHAVLQVYLVACWFVPDQGDSFGMRMFCESVPVVAVGLALAYRHLRGQGRFVLTLAVGASILWTSYRLVRYLYGA